MRVMATPRITWYYEVVTDVNGLDTVMAFTKGDKSLQVATTIQEMLLSLSATSLKGEESIETLLAISS